MSALTDLGSMCRWAEVGQAMYTQLLRNTASHDLLRTHNDCVCPKFPGF